jgi:hypothetical protein
MASLLSKGKTHKIVKELRTGKSVRKQFTLGRLMNICWLQKVKIQLAHSHDPLLRPSIDMMFGSVAAVYGTARSVLFLAAQTDGADGIAAIKRAGRITSPATFHRRVPQHAQAAIDTGASTWYFPGQIGRDPFALMARTRNVRMARGVTLNDLLEELAEQRNFDFRGYKKYARAQVSPANVPAEPG